MTSALDILSDEWLEPHCDTGQALVVVPCSGRQGTGPGSGGLLQGSSADGRLRHSRFLGLRRDKAPRDVHREVPAP